MKFTTMEGSTHAERVAFAEQWLRDAAERGEKYAGEKVPAYEGSAQFRKLVREIAKQCNPNYKPPTAASIAEKTLLKKFKRDRTEAEVIAKDVLGVPARVHNDLVDYLDDIENRHEGIDLDFLIPAYFKELVPEIKTIVAKLEAHLPRDEDGELVSRYHDKNDTPTEEQLATLMLAIAAQNAMHDARRDHRKMVEAKREGWREAHPDEHYPGERQYSDDGEYTVIAEADPTADKRLLGIDPFPGDEDDAVEMAA
jgi:hypothetical protein